MSIAQQYGWQVKAMARRAKEWRAGNPTKDAKVQFNYPREVAVIGSISDAIKTGYVTTNDAGLELVKALGPWRCENEPTVFMVRFALEAP
jgi:hypothetical protein